MCRCRRAGLIGPRGCGGLGGETKAGDTSLGGAARTDNRPVSIRDSQLGIVFADGLGDVPKDGDLVDDGVESFKDTVP